ncbi:hypothetical protein KCU87_g353, partial [Aureobasidium melanogenum]
MSGLSQDLTSVSSSKLDLPLTVESLRGISDGLRSTMTLCTPKAFKRAASATAALPAPTMKTFVLHMFVKAFELGAQDPDLPCQPHHSTAEDAIVERSLTRFGPAFLCLQQVFRNLGWRDEGLLGKEALLQLLGTILFQCNIELFQCKRASVRLACKKNLPVVIRHVGAKGILHDGRK